MEGITELDIDGIIGNLRLGSVAWANSKHEKEQVKPTEWGAISKVDSDKRVLGPVLKNTFNYISGRLSSTCDYLVHDRFIFDYDLRCNMDKPARFDTECVSFSFNIKWKVQRVDVSYYNGKLRPVRIQADMAAIINDMHVKDMSRFARITGLSSNDVKSAESSTKIDAILRLYSVGSAGQNKLSRLVKGCLILLDRLEDGGARFKDMKYYGMGYNVQSLYDRLGESNISYVYSSMPENETYNHFLYAMCEKYPHPILGGVKHVRIPEDSKSIYVVARNIHPGTRNVYLSASTIFGFLIQYADDFDLGEDLEKALAIACTLRENRYLRHVQLPKVSSVTDLIWPVLVRSTDGVGTKTILNHETAVMLGRYSQMLCLVLFKDIDTCIKNTSRSKRNQSITTRDLCSRDNLALVEYMQDKTCADIMLLTQEMVWLKNISDDDIEALREFSIFEAFWVVKYPKIVLRDGIIDHLKRGKKNPISVVRPGVYVDPFNTLCYELGLAGEDDDPTVPDGGFNLSLSSVRGASGKKEVIVMEFDIERDDCFGCEDEGVGPDNLRLDKSLGVYLDGAGGMSDKDSEFGSRSTEEEESGDGDSTKSRSSSEESDKRKNKKKKEERRLPEFVGGKDPDDVKNVELEIRWDEIGLMVDAVTSINGVLWYVKNGVLNPDKREKMNHYYCSIDVDMLVAARGIEFPKDPVVLPEDASFSTPPHRKPDGDGDSKGPEKKDGKSKDGGKEDGEEGGSDPQEPVVQQVETSSKPKENVAGRTAWADMSEEEERKEAGGEGEVPLVSVEFQVVGAPSVKFQSALVGESGPPADEEAYRASLEKVRTGKYTPPVGRKSTSTVGKTPPIKPAFLSSSPRSVSSTMYPPRAPEVGRGKPEVVFDWTNKELEEMEDMSIDKFCHAKARMGPVPRDFRSYLQCLPFTEELKKLKVVDILSNESLRKEVMDRVGWFLGQGIVRVEQYPEKYRGFMAEVHDVVASRESRSTEVPEEVFNAAQTNLEREVLSDPDEWKPKDGSMRIEDLKGLHRYMLKNDWWLERARACFGIPEDRTINANDLEWFARYFDQGGSIEGWRMVWRIANNSTITQNMEWVKVEDKMHAISKLQKKMKKEDGIVFKYSLDKKGDALNKLKAGDTMKGKTRLKKKEQNEFVDQMGDMTLGKAALVLAQLVETGVPIMHLEKYALIVRFLHVPAPWDDKLFEILQDYMD